MPIASETIAVGCISVVVGIVIGTLFSKFVDAYQRGDLDSDSDDDTDTDSKYELYVWH